MAIGVSVAAGCGVGLVVGAGVTVGLAALAVAVTDGLDVGETTDVAVGSA